LNRKGPFGSHVSIDELHLHESIRNIPFKFSLEIVCISIKHRTKVVRDWIMFI
jgi:hypothetical protein